MTEILNVLLVRFAEHDAVVPWGGMSMIVTLVVVVNVIVCLLLRRFLRQATATPTWRF